MPKKAESKGDKLESLREHKKSQLKASQVDQLQQPNKVAPVEKSDKKQDQLKKERDADRQFILDKKIDLEGKDIELVLNEMKTARAVRKDLAKKKRIASQINQVKDAVETIKKPEN